MVCPLAAEKSEFVGKIIGLNWKWTSLMATHWLRRFWQRLFARRPSGRQPYRREPVLLRLELLEDRVVPYFQTYAPGTFVAPAAINIFPSVFINYAQNISGATVRISSGLVPSEDRLLFTNPTGAFITSSYDTATGTLTLNGSTTGTNWSQILQAVQYNDIAADPSNGDRTFSFQLGPATYSSDTGHYYQFINTSNVTWSNAWSNANTRNDMGLT